jgi:hypothetical protein
MKYSIDCLTPTRGYYTILHDYFIQNLSDRRYARYVYHGFRPSTLSLVTKYCNTESFQAFVRLHSYSSHFFAFFMPLFPFFNYSTMHAYRALNGIESKLFRICRHGHLDENPLVVENITQFEINLNKRFFFSSIKKWINFSCFLLAGERKIYTLIVSFCITTQLLGGSVLNALLIDGFDSATQDLDLFWLGGSCIAFYRQIERFKRRAKSYIIKEQNMYGQVIDFILSFDKQHTIHVQFVFGRHDCNAAFVLYTFDIDIVQVGYDGIKIISVRAIYFIWSVLNKLFS